MSEGADRGLRCAVEAARQVGANVFGAKVLRAQSSMHVDLPRAGIVARVEAPGNEEIARAQVWAARLLAERGAPAARLFRPEVQPIVVGDVAVTLWHRLRALETPGFRELGRTLRAFHQATSSALPAETRRLDPFGRARSELAWPSAWSNTEASEELLHRLELLESEWPSAIHDDPLGTVVVHGDIHLENMMQAEGGPVLIDLEDAGVGPATWDFVPLTVQVKRYGLPPASHSEFLAGYGAEPYGWPGWPGLDLMCRVYELLSVVWAIRCSDESPRMAAEAAIRVDGLLHGGERPWTLL